jgi:hypothetical protein
MSKFLTKLNAKLSNEWDDSGKFLKFTRTIKLKNSLHYESDLLKKIVVVPRGFVSDGASVPRALWSIYPPFGKYLEAAVVHDWYCVLGNKGESPIDYKMAAKVFREAMAVCGVNKWRRFKMYWAVILGGPKFSAKKSE